MVKDSTWVEEYTNQDKPVRKLAKGAMLRHTRSQNRNYLGKELRKYFRSAFFEARLARRITKRNCPRITENCLGKKE